MAQGPFPLTSRKTYLCRTLRIQINLSFLFCTSPIKYHDFEETEIFSSLSPLHICKNKKFFKLQLLKQYLYLSVLRVPGNFDQPMFIDTIRWHSSDVDLIFYLFHFARLFWYFQFNNMSTGLFMFTLFLYFLVPCTCMAN